MTDGAAEAERLIGYLRIVALPVLIVGQVYVNTPEPTPLAFKIVMTGFTAFAVMSLIFVHRRPVTPELQVALALLDTAFAGGLAFTSGGGFSQLRFAFLFAPVTTAFRFRPKLTLAVAVAAVTVYVLQALPHPSRRSRGDWSSFVAVQTAYIAWIGAASTLMCSLLARRQGEVTRLLAARQLLVAETLAAEERERKRLAEDLHDDAIQSLLAARHDLEDAAETDPDGPVASAYASLTSTLTRLRESVAQLHPYLLDTAGIEVALTRAAERAARRGGFELSLRIERDEPSPNDRVLLRCATELLSNCVRHAGAHTVAVTLERFENTDRLRVDDDGCGFDPARMDERLREGHIGLVSLRERAEALGGRLQVDTAVGRGSKMTLELPRSRVIALAGQGR